ncbi:MAG: hypothetical protein WDO74_07975 [Pseudomonadota bacterium]
MSRLREILFAEDAWRKNAYYDPDGDHVGSAGLLGELSAEFGVRGGDRVEPAVLEGYPKLVETRLGPAADIGGYLVLVCLPKQGGGYSAKPGDAIDDEGSERHFLRLCLARRARPGSDDRRISWTNTNEFCWQIAKRASTAD